MEEIDKTKQADETTDEELTELDREAEYQERTGRCYHCGRPLLECICDELGPDWS